MIVRNVNKKEYAEHIKQENKNKGAGAIFFGSCITLSMTPFTALFIFLLTTNPPSFIKYALIGALIPFGSVSILGIYSLINGFNSLQENK